MSSFSENVLDSLNDFFKLLKKFSENELKDNTVLAKLLNKVDSNNGLVLVPRNESIKSLGEELYLHFFVKTPKTQLEKDIVAALKKIYAISGVESEESSAVTLATLIADGQVWENTKEAAWTGVSRLTFKFGLK